MSILDYIIQKSLQNYIIKMRKRNIMVLFYAILIKIMQMMMDA